MFQKILLAWDGSAVALRAFDIAIDLSRRYDVELVAVSIAYSPAHAETAADRRESADAARRHLVDSFTRVRDRAERAGVEVRHEILEGDEPHATLLAYCQECGFDLIVAGDHREGRVGRLLLHGVAPKLVAAASTPVLVVGEHER
jgi:nucleotide-binding universal stress UspA family protein